MKNLTPLPLPPTYISYFVAIRDAKRIPAGDQGTTRDHRHILTESYEAIQRRYTRFEEAIDQGTLEALRRSNAMQLIGSSLRSCYDGETKRLRALKDSIAAAQGIRVLKYCPLCGISSVATHDHYVPATLFPEFAVHPLNLVPCCFTCNSTKGDDWLDEDGNRLYLHTYSDMIPVEVFLDVELKTSQITTGVGAVFSIARPNGFNTMAWAIVESHFERLNLIKRYTDFANDEIAEILADCKIYTSSGGTDVRRFLRRRARERTSIYGLSYWRSVLMKKLAGARGLDAWIERIR
jgi:5-methylcytosine-specific restriction endonuclease McrA